MRETMLNLPYSEDALASLRAGGLVLLSGTVYTARDAAHKRLCALLEEGKPLPFAFDGAAVFYAGPCPPPPGRVCGSIGPTTSARMDAYSPTLLRAGLRLMIGKGPRGAAVREAMRETGGVYLAAVGGAAAVTASCVEAVEVIAFEDLGTEAIRALKVRSLPLIVAIDGAGNSVV